MNLAVNWSLFSDNSTSTLLSRLVQTLVLWTKYISVLNTTTTLLSRIVEVLLYSGNEVIMQHYN